MPGRLLADLSQIYLSGRLGAAAAGRQRLGAELGQFDPELEQHIRSDQRGTALGALALLDLRRASRAAHGAVARWQEAWSKAVSANDTRPERAALEAAQNSLRLGAATETSEAFSGSRQRILSLQAERLRELDLVRVWNAKLDKRTCSRCSASDGKWVLVGERFSWGEPGAVHPKCRCYDEILPRAWVSPLDIAA